MAALKPDSDNFFAELMAKKAQWDQECKERGTDLESQTTSAQTEAKQKKTAKPVRNNFALPSGTAPLTEKNLKKMEVAQAQQDIKSRFSKDKRFKEPEMDDKQLLYPKIDFSRQTFHASKTAIRPKTKKNEKFNDMESQTASTAATSAAGDRKATGTFGSPNKGVVIAKISALSDAQLERLLRLQFRKNVKQISQDCVTKEVKFDVVDKNVRGPRMTSKTNESRLKIEEEWQKRRGPTMMSYNVKQDVVLPNKTEISFPKTDIVPKPDQGDWRRPLDPNLDAVRKVAQKSKIAPEHEMVQSEMIKEYIATKGGPTTYDPRFKLVEARADVGIQKFRKDYIEKIEEEDTQPALEPNYNFTKPNKLVFKYFQPTEQRPPNMPESEALPGRWVFYDVDLDAVRAELAQNIYMGAKDETRQEYAEREEFQRLLEEHIKRKQERRPEHGDYANPHAENKIEGAFVDFERQLGRDEEKELDEMDELEGDVLILDPEKLKKRLPDINFEKMLGRPEKVVHEEDDKEGDVLDLEPKKLDKKLQDIVFDKQLGREEPRTLDDDEVYVLDLPEDPIPKDPSAPKVIAHDFGKGADRFNHDIAKLNEDLDLGEDEVFLDPQPLERKIKGHVKMDGGVERFKEKLNEDPFYDDQPLNELDNDVHGALQNAIKPAISVPDFKRYTNGGKEKKIQDVIQEADIKTKKTTADKSRAKDAYAVKKHFKGGSAAAKKKKAAAKNKPKQAIESAQEEVDRYLAELGFM